MLYVNTNEEKKVRVRLVSSYDEDTSPINFLKKKDMLMEFLTSEEALVGKGRIVKEIKASDIEKKGRYLTHDGKKYLLMETKYKILSYDLYEVLPDVYDNEILRWKKNKKHGTREAKFELGMFEYLCTYRDDGTVMIGVKYTKCDNPHRNKVTVETIEVRDATNERIFDAIEQWKVQMIGMLK